MFTTKVGASFRETVFLWVKEYAMGICIEQNQMAAEEYRLGGFCRAELSNFPVSAPRCQNDDDLDDFDDDDFDDEFDDDFEDEFEEDFDDDDFDDEEEDLDDEDDDEDDFDEDDED
ncbi:MAG: hypothetical protein RBS80_08065 [Thermoguttaceae bacterium]|jgi:hypothetical protein|nr:hypothetical protein [Thermoguttaceae bacterium]